MSGDENAKTPLGIGGADDLAHAQRAKAARADVAVVSGEAGENDDGNESENPAVIGDVPESLEVSPSDSPFAVAIEPPSEVPSTGGFELSVADSSPFQLSEDSEGFKIKSDPSPSGAPAKQKSPGYDLRAAELSVVRRLGADSVLGASSLDSLDWDLGDDDDPPSGLDQVFTQQSGGSELPSPPPSPEWLPSTSALFGSNYRRDSNEESANARTPLSAGDSNSGVDHALPEVEPLLVLDGSVLVLGGHGDSPPSPVESEAADDGAVIGGLADSFEGVVLPARPLVGEPRPNTPFSHRSSRLPPPTSSRSSGPGVIEPATVGTLKPSNQETPVVSTRFAVSTPFITSPVAAAGRPTPEDTPCLGRPLQKRTLPGSPLSWVILAGFIIIGLIAAALTYFR